MLFQVLNMPPLLQGQPQGLKPPVLPHFVQQGDTLPVLRSTLQPRESFPNTVHTPAKYCTTSANVPWFNASNPNIRFPGVPVSQWQPLNTNCRLSGLQSDCIGVNDSANTSLPKYPPWTLERPVMSIHPQTSGESSVFPGLAVRPVVSQPAIPQVMTNAPRLTSMGTSGFPSPEFHSPTYNFSRMPTNVQCQQRPTLSQLPPLSYSSKLRPHIKDLQPRASLASNISSTFHQDKLRAIAAVDRNQILQCIRRPPPPYHTMQVHPNRQDPHSITHLPRRASANLDHWRTDSLLQPAPHKVSFPAPTRDTTLNTRVSQYLLNFVYECILKVISNLFSVYLFAFFSFLEKRKTLNLMKQFSRKKPIYFVYKVYLTYIGSQSWLVLFIFVICVICRLPMNVVRQAQ